MSFNVASTTDVIAGPRRKRGRTWLSVLALILVMWLGIAWLAARVLIVRSAAAPVDALAMLAGSSTYVERAHHAANLFKAGRAPLIVLTNDGQHSGWSVLEQRNLFFLSAPQQSLKNAAFLATALPSSRSLYPAPTTRPSHYALTRHAIICIRW